MPDPPRARLGERVDAHRGQFGEGFGGGREGHHHLRVGALLEKIEGSLLRHALDALDHRAGQPLEQCPAGWTKPSGPSTSTVTDCSRKPKRMTEATELLACERVCALGGLFRGAARRRAFPTAVVFFIAMLGCSELHNTTNARSL